MLENAIQIIMNPAVYYVAGSVYFVLAIIKLLSDRKLSKQNTIHYSQDAPTNISKLSQAEPANKPPIVLSIVLVVSGFLLLIFAFYSIWLWFSGRVIFHFDTSFVFFILIFVVFPLFVLIDTFFIEPIYFRLGKSFAAREAIIEFDVNIEEAFNDCQRALVAIESDIVRLDKPKYLVALTGKPKFRLGKTKITIRLRGIRSTKCKATVICDNQWLTVKTGAGTNQQYLDLFKKALFNRPKN